jgi:hypothetical protein
MITTIKFPIFQGVGRTRQCHHLRAHPLPPPHVRTLQTVAIYYTTVVGELVGEAVRESVSLHGGDAWVSPWWESCWWWSWWATQ